jgi:hypothetical protein
MNTILQEEWKKRTSARDEPFSYRHEQRDDCDFVSLLVAALWPARGKV